MKRKLFKPKAPLSRRKTTEKTTEDKEKNIKQDDRKSNIRVGDDGIGSSTIAASAKSKCYRQTRHVGTRTQVDAASSSNEDQSQTSAFDYNSDEDLPCKDSEAASRTKRKKVSSKDEESTSSQYPSRYKKSQQAINLIRKSDEEEKKNVKKRKGRAAKSSSSSSEEQDFDKPLKKSLRLVLPNDEIVKLAPPTTRGRNKKTLLNLKKNKRNVGTQDQLSEESNTDTSANELGVVDPIKGTKLVEPEEDVDGDDERDGGESDYNPKPEQHHSSTITRFEHESDQMNQDNNVENMKSKIKCPVCSKVFGELVEQAQINDHVNSCLDGKSTTEADVSENNAKSSVSLLQDQLVAFEYHRKEIQGCDDNFGEEDLLNFCQICQKDLSKMNSQRRQQHTNRCCDQMEKEKEEEKAQQVGKDDTKKGVLTCPFCNMEFKSKKSWQPHIKKCAQENKVPVNQLIEIVKQLHQHQQEMESKNKLTKEKTEARVSEDAKKKPGQVRKKRKRAQDLSNVDEETQLAMALSVSMAPPPPPENDDLTRKPKRKRKRKKENEVIPALLLRSKEETQNVIAARAAQVVCNKDEDSDEDSISCTPALARSSLAEQFSKVEKANSNMVKGESNSKVTEKTKATLSEDLNQYEGEAFVEKDSSNTPDTSMKATPTSCEDATVVSLPDMLASPDMCRSFLSFLDVVEEEAVAKDTNDESCIQPSTSTKDGQSTSLWSMASLVNRQSSINDFYVPGLLPVQSPKRPRKTPRKSSSTLGEQKSSAGTGISERLGKSTVKKSEDNCENKRQESLDKLNKTMSESEITSASQAVNLDILLALADDDDEEESQKTPRKSSVDDDDDEVFPSSGFCLPVGPNHHTDKEEHSVSPSLTAFLQDMSKMVGNKLLSDVMIVTKGNENIPAHSFMLATRSQVLAKMISDARRNTNGLQSGDTTVHLCLNDVETDAVRCILQYIYTAMVNVPQSCIDYVIVLADRLELFELVQACQDSKTIYEKQQQTGDEEQEEEDDQSVRCSLSAQELLDAIWQDETGDFETKQSNEEQSQEDCNEGFDDDDIEEVRIFQTQALHKRTCSDEKLEESSLDGVLFLDVKGYKEEDKNVENLNQTITETSNSSTENSDGKLLAMEFNDGNSEGHQSDGKESNFVVEHGDDQPNESTTLPKETKSLDVEVIQLKTDELERSLDENEIKNLYAKDLEIEKDSVIPCQRKEDGDFGKRDTEADNACDFRKGDTNVDQDGAFDCDAETNLESDAKATEKTEPSRTSSIQTTDMLCEIYDNDDDHDDDDNELGDEVSFVHDDDTNHCNQSAQVDLTEDDDDDHDNEDDKKEVASKTDRSERDKDKSVDEDSEVDHAADIALLDQSISLLSDDNDCFSPEQIANDMIIPETPHPKRKEKRHSSLEEQNIQQSSKSLEHSSTGSVQSDHDSRDDTNENEKDHVSEDEEAFLDKLKSRINAKVKSSGKEKKKRKGREKPTKSRARNKRTSKNMSTELECSSSSNRYDNSSSTSVCTPTKDAGVVDLSSENENEDLMNECASNHFENQVDSEGNNSDRGNRRSHDDEERSCSSASPPRMLSPRAPSPCYSDFDHELPSPALSPACSVHSDVAVVEPAPHRIGNHSPVGTPLGRGLSTEMNDEVNSQAKEDLRTEEEEEDRMEGGVLNDSPLRKVHQVDDSDHESESSDIVALLPVPTSDCDKTKRKYEEAVDKADNKTYKSSTTTKSSLFKRLGASKYGLESTETKASSDVESEESGLDSTPRERKSQETNNVNVMTRTTPSIADRDDYFEDGGFNCDVDDFGACLDGDDSFMMHAAEQMQLAEEQDIPDKQEKPDCGVQPRTPAHIQRSTTSTTPRNNKVQDMSNASPITPMPDYDSMTTPDLKVEVKKFGVRPLPKNKMKAKLVEMYNYTHPEASSQAQSTNNSKETTSSKTTKNPSSKATTGQRPAKAPSRTKGASSEPTKQVTKKKGPASQIRESSDSDDNGHPSVRSSSQGSSSLKSSRYETQKRSKKILPSTIEEGSSSSSYSSQPVISSRRLVNNRIESTSSMSDEDKGAGRGSGDSNNEDEEEFGDVSILIDSETVTASQQVNNDNLENNLLTYFESHQDLYLKVINYQPIDLMSLHELIKSDGIKCRLGQLLDFLDNQCITFTTAGQKPRQRRKPPRKKR